MGKALVVIGVIFILVGIAVTYGPRIPFLGKLPGDIYYKKDNFVFYFPLATSVLVSIVLSLVLYFLTRK